MTKITQTKMTTKSSEDGQEVEGDAPLVAHRWVDDGTFTEEELEEFQFHRRAAGLKPL